MKVACKLLLGLALLQGAAYAADEPKIEVIDGKISISAQAVPLGRFLTMFDKAMGLKSEVKPGLENRNISVQFTGLNFNDAIRKIFQGQPYNYMVIRGKGIRVTDLAQAGSATTSADSPSPSPSSSFTTSSQPFNSPLQQPLQVFPNNNNQPTASSIFGGPLPAAANNNPVANPTAPLSGPGVMPPAGGGSPFITPMTGPYANGTVAPPPVQPAAPGTLPGATPGAAPGTIK